MDMNQAAQAGKTALRTARFEYAPDAEDYDKALWRYTLGTWPGRTRYLLLPALLGAAAGIVRVVLWGLGEIGYIAAGVTAVIAVPVIRQLHRRSRMRGLYAADAARGALRTTLTEDGLTATGLIATGEAGTDDTSDWRGYPWWFETPELFVLTGSMEHFFVLPKRGAASPEDIDRARALFTEHLRRI
ncbi:YcxB family protein [Streptomyces sp. NBC_00536]|uniref:hypothetical protein n=1 Tax=Streptomyces sp. NBC_00536 TaxID=2975769 RepID=UPI002E807722|nr:hypothetical protein [Streptomyces sp. NBC_00536]WUC78260.1 YcxB family protein [Streptomyces sp. NBC_00536]